MTSILQILLHKLNAFLDRPSFYGLSTNLLSGLEKTVYQLKAKTCHETPDITEELIMASMTNAVINLLLRHPMPSSPRNINQRLIAAFSIVINQYYGEDTIPGESALQILVNSLRLDHRLILNCQADFCRELRYDIGFNRRADGELITFPSQALDAGDIDRLMAMNVLECAIMSSLHAAPGGAFNLPSHYAFIVFDLWPTLFEWLQPDAFLTQMHLLTPPFAFKQFVSWLNASTTLTPLVVKLNQLHVEKLAPLSVEHLTSAPFPADNEEPQELYRTLVRETVQKHGTDLCRAYLKQDLDAITAICRLAFPLQTEFCYLVVLSHLRTYIFQQAIQNYFPEDQHVQRHYIKTITSSALSQELPWQAVINELQALTTPSATIEAPEFLLDACANRHYRQLPSFARLLTRGLLQELLSKLPKNLPCTASIAKALWKRIKDRLHQESNNQSTTTPLLPHLQALITQHRYTDREFSRVLGRAFWAAVEHYPVIGFEVIQRFYITRNYNQPANCAQWSDQASAVHNELIHAWNAQNQDRLSFNQHAFWETFTRHLQHPETGNELTLNNVHRFDLDEIQNNLCRAWLTNSCQTALTTPSMGQGR